MKRLSWFTFSLFLIVLFLGCGKSDKAEQREQETVAQRPIDTTHVEKPDHIPAPPPSLGLTRPVMDSLRAKKKLYRITRDEYWQGIGGVLANDQFEVWYPKESFAVAWAMGVFVNLTPAIRKFELYFGQPPTEPLVVVTVTTMEDYQESTGRDWWHYSEIKGDTVKFQPLSVLLKRNLAHIAMPHEYYEWAIGRFTNWNAPRWLEEGLASYLSQEGTVLESQVHEFPDRYEEVSIDDLNKILLEETSRKDTRLAYYRAHMMVTNLIDVYGDQRMRKAVRLLGGGLSWEEASSEAFGVDFDEVMELATDYSMDP